MSWFDRAANVHLLLNPGPPSPLSPVCTLKVIVARLHVCGSPSQHMQRKSSHSPQQGSPRDLAVAHPRLQLTDRQTDTHTGSRHTGSRHTDRQAGRQAGRQLNGPLNGPLNSPPSAECMNSQGGQTSLGMRYAAPYARAHLTGEKGSLPLSL
jgi:hypothetical protein